MRGEARCPTEWMVSLSATGRKPPRGEVKPPCQGPPPNAGEPQCRAREPHRPDPGLAVPSH